MGNIDHNKKLSQVFADISYGADFKDKSKQIELSFEMSRNLRTLMKADADLQTRFRFPAMVSSNCCYRLTCDIVGKVLQLTKHATFQTAFANLMGNKTVAFNNYLTLFLHCFPKLLVAFPKQIKELKTLVWHLSREPVKEMSSLKKTQNKQ